MDLIDAGLAAGSGMIIVGTVASMFGWPSDFLVVFGAIVASVAAFGAFVVWIGR